jgi:hypothetical protein
LNVVAERPEERRPGEGAKRFDSLAFFLWDLDSLSVRSNYRRL